MTSVITATTEVVISEKSILELASVELTGTIASRMSMMRITAIWALIDVRTLGVCDDLLPLRPLGFNVARKCGGRAAIGLEAKREHFLLHLRILHDRRDLALQGIDDFLRSALRHEHALHRFRVLAGDAGPRKRRHVGARRGALFGGDGGRANLAGLEQLGHRRHR